MVWRLWHSKTDQMNTGSCVLVHYIKYCTSYNHISSYYILSFVAYVNIHQYPSSWLRPIFTCTLLYITSFSGISMAFCNIFLIISGGEIATIVDHLCCWHTFTSPFPLVISVLCLVMPAMGSQIWKLIVTLLVSTQFRCPRRIPNPPKQLERFRN
jgi:hypothetical protein